MLLMVLVPLAIGATRTAGADTLPDARFPLFAYLTGESAASLVAYTPSELDPRQEINQKRLATSSIRADLEALRPAFDGLVLYGYNEACTPRVAAVARQLKFRAVVLAVWDPRPAAELDGVAELACLYDKETGLPHAGKEMFTPEAQAAFWSSYLEPGRLNRGEGRSRSWAFHGVAFEAFDLPWKSEESGLIIEKSWGLLAPARRPYPAFQVWRSTPAR